MKKNKVIDVLSYALDTFNVPPLNRIKIYHEMYNKKTFKQNAFLKKIINHNLESHDLHSKNFNDIIDMSYFQIALTIVLYILMITLHYHRIHV